MKLAAMLVCSAVVLGSASAGAQSYAIVVQPQSAPPSTPLTAGEARAMQITGIVMVASGVATFSAGVVSMSTDHHTNFFCDPTEHCTLTARDDADIGMWLGGIALGALGIPFWIVGAKRFHETETVSMVPAVLPSGRGAALRWTF